jgi:uncharacterized protein (DUF488 family)
MRVLTIGHSNLPMTRFLQLLEQFGIEAVADIRSFPRSRYSPHFDREDLSRALARAGKGYVYLGGELGGRPKGDEFYDYRGHVLYSRVAQSSLFNGGIDRLQSGACQRAMAIVCSEENPAVCHRHLLVGRVLTSRGMAVNHIRADGRLQTEAGLEREERQQMALFDEIEVDEWKSIPSVSQKKRQNSFSAF